MTADKKKSERRGHWTDVLVAKLQFGNWRLQRREVLGLREPWEVCTCDTSCKAVCPRWAGDCAREHFEELHP